MTATKGPTRKKNMTAGKKLTQEEQQQILDLIAEGVPIPAAAKSVNVSKQAVYMRRGRDPEWDIAVERAEAKAFVKAWRELKAAVDKGSKTWQGFAWILERRFRILHPLHEAKIAHAMASVEDIEARRKNLRSFVESVRSAEEGDPDAVLPDDRYEDELEEVVPDPGMAEVEAGQVGK